MPLRFRQIRKMLFVILWVCFFIFTAAAGCRLVLSCAPPLRAASSKRTPVIAVIKSMENPHYGLALKGFGGVLEENGINARIEIYMKTDKDLIRKIRNREPNLVLTLGTCAAKFVSSAISDIPVVFSQVADPWGSGLTSKHLVGASLDIPVKTRMKYFCRVVPGIKQVGVIYCPSYNERTIREARQAIAELGLILKAYPVQSNREILEIGDLNIDGLLVITDPIVCQPVILKRILLSGLRERIPVMGYSRFNAKAGALLSVSCDDEDIGRQAGEIALRILKGEKYSDLTISRPRKIKLYLNERVAERLQIKIPAKILQRADEVFGK